MKKIILCDGDSWTSGDIINPILNTTDVNHKDNDEYRLPKVWPSKLGKLLNISMLNISRAGSSNDGIVRRVMRKIPELLEQYKSDEIFVIIGWSSPERKDFYYKGVWESWETLYPAQYNQIIPDKDLDTFYKIYLKRFWNEEEYLERYIQQNLLLYYFLDSYNISHCFFDAFYEIKDGGIYSNIEIIDVLKDTLFSKEYLKVRKKVFKDESFRRFLMKNGSVFKDGVFGEDLHQTEKGHELWSEELYKFIDKKVIL